MLEEKELVIDALRFNLPYYRKSYLTKAQQVEQTLPKWANPGLKKLEISKLEHELRAAQIEEKKAEAGYLNNKSSDFAIDSILMKNWKSWHSKVEDLRNQIYILRDGMEI